MANASNIRSAIDTNRILTQISVVVGLTQTEGGVCVGICYLHAAVLARRRREEGWMR